MSVQTCREILDHVTKHFVCNPIVPYNWGEPFLHPNLPELLELFSNYPKRVMISSNLSLRIPIEVKKAVLKYAHLLKVSASGIDQEVYKKYHIGGNIDKVLKNLDDFVTLKNQLGSKTQIDWIFGRTLNNHNQEAKIKEYCESKGINFCPERYFIPNIENVYKIFKGKALPESLYNQHHETLRNANSYIDQHLTPSKCVLLTRDITTDYEGKVTLCCASGKTLPLHITEVKNMRQLVKKRLADEFCHECYKAGLVGYLQLPTPPKFIRKVLRKLSIIYSKFGGHFIRMEQYE
jgi:MoaA/NifB/PqqE/SkfB family radical SAM enzyme